MANTDGPIGAGVVVMPNGLAIVSNVLSGVVT